MTFLRRRGPGVAISALLLRIAGRFRRFARDEDGLSITEYGMLVAFAALALIALATVFGTQISAWFAAKTNGITTI